MSDTQQPDWFRAVSGQLEPTRTIEDRGDNLPEAAGEPDTEKRIARDRPWNEYPIGTKAPSGRGGYWVRVCDGWQWRNGDIFPTPGGDNTGYVIMPSFPELCPEHHPVWYSLLGAADGYAVEIFTSDQEELLGLVAQGLVEVDLRGQRAWLTAKGKQAKEEVLAPDAGKADPMI